MNTINNNLSPSLLRMVNQKCHTGKKTFFSEVDKLAIERGAVFPKNFYTGQFLKSQPAFLYPVCLPGKTIKV
jgi:hypothetical protein